METATFTTQELKFMDLLNDLKPEDRLFIYSEQHQKDFGITVATLLQLLTPQAMAMQYIFAPVNSKAELQSINVNNAALFPDNWLIQVKGAGTYALDRTSQAPANGDSILKANGPGNWIGKGSPENMTDYVSANNGGTFKKDITVEGYVTARNFIGTSDGRLKENATPLCQVMDPLQTMRKLQFKRYNWKDSAQIGYGVIAQELQALHPDMVHQKEETLHVDFYALLSVVGAALQQLDEKVVALERRNRGWQNVQ